MSGKPFLCWLGYTFWIIILLEWNIFVLPVESTRSFGEISWFFKASWVPLENKQSQSITGPCLTGSFMCLFLPLLYTRRFVDEELNLSGAKSHTSRRSPSGMWEIPQIYICQGGSEMTFPGVLWTISACRWNLMIWRLDDPMVPHFQKRFLILVIWLPAQSVLKREQYNY